MESIIKNNQNTTDLCNKLKSAEKQYPPLSKAEERNLINKYKNNREQLNQLLFMHNIRLVFNIAKKYVSKTNDFDNLVQDGMVGLGEAAKRFDINKDVKFCTYATIWIKKYVLMNFYGKSVDVDKHSISLDTIIQASNSKSNSTNDSCSIENCINNYVDPSVYVQKTVEQELSANEQHALYKALLTNMKKDNSLSAIDKAVFIETVCNKERSRYIAEKYNITMEDVNQIKSKILTKFRSILKNEYQINSFYDLNM